MITSERPALEVADIIRAHGDEFHDKYAAILSHAQKKALRGIGRTQAALSGLRSRTHRLQLVP